MANLDSGPRRWWAAGLLTIFGLGAAGYLYVGRLRRAIVAALAFLVLGIALSTGFGGLLTRPVPFFSVLALQLAIGLFFVVDSARIALRETEFRPQPYNQNWIYAAVVVLSSLLSWFVLKPGVRSFEVFSASMEPTLIAGDRVLADIRAQVPKRGTLVVMALPSDPSVSYLRRVIGVPGDRVQMVHGVLQLNGAPVTLTQTDTKVPGGDGIVYRETLPGGPSYLILDKQPDGISDDTGIFEVSDGSYFVLGDSRDNSTDSRMREVGAVPAGNIIGTITGIYWSRDFSRIGRSLE